MYGRSGTSFNLTITNYNYSPIGGIRWLAAADDAEAAERVIAPNDTKECIREASAHGPIERNSFGSPRIRQQLVKPDLILQDDRQAAKL